MPLEPSRGTNPLYIVGNDSILAAAQLLEVDDLDAVALILRDNVCVVANGLNVAPPAILAVARRLRGDKTDDDGFLRGADVNEVAAT